MRGSNGERRPCNPAVRAVMVAQIAAGEREETLPSERNGGLKGGPRRASPTSQERSAIARKTAEARWKKTS